MKLNKLTLKDRVLFRRYLGLSGHKLSVYSFENIFIWISLFNIRWQVIDANLCVFFCDSIGCFLYFSPLGKTKSPEAVRVAFEVMDGCNKNKEISRIENVQESELDFYRDLGYTCKEKSLDYLCCRVDLAYLKGDKFKSKRASCNYFIKHNDFEYLSYSSKHKDSCLWLYDYWMEQRLSKNNECFYRGMMQDSLKSFQVLLDNFSKLDYTGRVVLIGGQLRAFTFGYRISADTFCILYEITDLMIKGLAQFIFRKFCSELKDYTYINIMDDSGLESLKKVKMSYHPAKLVPAYIAKRTVL
ncbi:MAG: phosphatidylglycerol lysyltransferase domain-containing protein [Candidatus Omnitrophica bacterium]|nr:phosphatidylglycerol lysyltransferase domain-containing protein [Candidatus Omnitrophota bacterium]